MSVDTVNYALTRVRRQIAATPDAFSESGQRKLLAVCDIMRDHLMKEDPVGFEAYIDGVLAREPDAADYVLDAIYHELRISTREHLAAKLAEE